MLKSGDTFLLDSGPSGKHLFVVLSDPKVIFGYGRTLIAVSVSITTYHVGRANDNTCIIEVGEHPFITRKSFAYYRGAVILREHEYSTGLASGHYVRHERVSDDLLNRLIQGFHASRAVSREVKDCF